MLGQRALVARVGVRERAAQECIGADGLLRALRDDRQRQPGACSGIVDRYRQHFGPGRAQLLLHMRKLGHAGPRFRAAEENQQHRAAPAEVLQAAGRALGGRVPEVHGRQPGPRRHDSLADDARLIAGRQRAHEVDQIPAVVLAERRWRIRALPPESCRESATRRCRRRCAARCAARSGRRAAGAASWPARRRRVRCGRGSARSALRRGSLRPPPRWSDRARWACGRCPGRPER